MKRVLCVTCVVSAVLAMAAMLTVPAGAQDEETPSIKTIMQRLHKGQGAALPAAKAALQATPTDWPAVQKAAGPLILLGAALEKNDVTKGEQESYVKLSRDYLEDAKSLSAAANKQDLPAAQASLTELGKSCAACHKVHKP